MPSDQQDESQLPVELVTALRELYATPAVPSRVDEAIVNRGLSRLAGLRRWRPVLRIASLAAAAAIVLLAVGIVINRPPRAPQVAGQHDLNGDGVVDIRDALYLAHHANAPKAQWDFNHDGRVDRSDADVIAQQAVSLKGATP